jgi:hypothetical protein
MRLDTFDFNAAFAETAEEHVYGVWVGEHGFLVAVFRDKLDAAKYVNNKPQPWDYEINKIDVV